MFDEQFPRTSSKFDMFPPTANEFVRGVKDRTILFTWSQWVLSCELLTRAASYRSEGNLWEVQRFYGRVSYLRGEFAMVRQTKQKDPISDKSKAEWKGFLDYRLTEEELMELDQWKPKPTEVWEEVDELINAGYRLTLTYNPKMHMASCTIIDDSNTRPTGGYALSSMDSDGALALKMATFKHRKLDRTWISLLDKPPTLGRRG